MNSVDMLHDIWALERLNDVAYQTNATQEHPSLEINTIEMQAFGTDGCNRFTGPVDEVTSDQLRFGNLASTRRACRQGAELSAAFLQALQATERWSREGLELQLLDGSGETLMTLRKVD